MEYHMKDVHEKEMILSGGTAGQGRRPSGRAVPTSAIATALIADPTSSTPLSSRERDVIAKPDAAPIPTRQAPSKAVSSHYTTSDSYQQNHRAVENAVAQTNNKVRGKELRSSYYCRFHSPKPTLARWHPRSWNT